MTQASLVLNLAAEIDILMSEIFQITHGLDVTKHVYLGERAQSTALAETLVETLANELFISVRVSNQLAHDISSKPSPFKILTTSNLGLLAIMAEEMSHFYEICAAANSERVISRWDLELQSEFDKFLIAATLMKRQTGRPHLRHLARLLFDSTLVYQPDPIYDLTGNIAAKWWWHHINNWGDNLMSMPFLNRTLRQMRALHGHSKLEFVKATSSPLVRVSA